MFYQNLRLDPRETRKVIRQIPWNIGSVFGTFFKTKNLNNYKVSLKTLLQVCKAYYELLSSRLHTYQILRYVRNYVL